jgi:hypothetical protein
MIILTGDLDMEDYEEDEESTLRQFQRNNYFYGKLMTVSDFDLEQDYFNGKRYLLNRLIYGQGLLFGFYDLKLEPENSDEVNIWFRDGGVALDCLGREIIVPRDEKKKVMSKERKPLKKSEFINPTYLCLKYKPFLIDYVRAASSPLSCEEVVCANRIFEDFEVVASFDHEDIESDNKVFFAIVKLVNKELSIDKESPNKPHYFKTESNEAKTSFSSSTGVVSFEHPTVNSITSDLIDHKLGEGPIYIQLGLETEDGKILTSSATDIEKNGSKINLGTILDPKRSKFRVQVVFKDESERRTINVRWWAYKSGLECGKEFKNNIFLKKYNFAAQDSEVTEKGIPNGLCKTGAKNYNIGGIIGGDHYAKVGDDVALNGNPEKLAELIIDQDKIPMSFNKDWYIGGDWRLRVNHYEEYSKPQSANISLYYGEDEKIKSLDVFKGKLIYHCEDIEGEKGAPLFVTYVDDIYIPVFGSLAGKDSRITLKYTWAISRNVRVLNKEAEKSKKW